MTVTAQNPYVHYATGVDGPATNLALITPSDTDQLAKACKSLRVYNPTAGAVTVAFVTTGGATVTLTFPANSLVVEPVIVLQVLLTGTSAGVILHGYTD